VLAAHRTCVLEFAHAGGNISYLSDGGNADF
jgi:hypothetical protein